MRPTRAASAWRASTTRIFPSPRSCSHRPCARTSPRFTRSRGRPTTSPTSQACPTPIACGNSTTGAQRLDRAAQPGIPKPPVDVPDEIFVALAHTIRECRLPASLFHDLLSAFRQDVLQKRYATWSDVLDYCRRSANPVGRLVLRVAGHHSATLDARSDEVCTALQLANFWQDLERDWNIGRVYVPEQDRARAGATRRGSGRPTDVPRVASGHGGDGAADTRALRLRPRRLRRPRRPPALGAASDVSWRLPNTGSPRTFGLRRIQSPANAGRPRRTGASLARHQLERDNIEKRDCRPSTDDEDCRLRLKTADRRLLTDSVKRHQLLLLVPGPAAREASRHRRGLGFLSSGRRRDR